VAEASGKVTVKQGVNTFRPGRRGGRCGLDGATNEAERKQKPKNPDSANRGCAVLMFDLLMVDLNKCRRGAGMSMEGSGNDDGGK
jgi:hypothetical protein